MLKYNQANETLGHAIDSLPKDEKMLPLYLNVLKCTDNHVIRGEMAYLLSQLCPQNADFINVLLELLVSDKTAHAKGSLLFALSETNYFDLRVLFILKELIVHGNYECRLKAYAMLCNNIQNIPQDKLHEIRYELDQEREILTERLELLEDILEKL